MYNSHMPNKHRLGIIVILFLVMGLFPPMRGAASPEPRLNILNPGDNSILPSPIKLSAEILPDPQSMIRVTLTSRNGELLARQLIHLDTNSSSPIVFNKAIPFEIPTDQTEALLTLAVQDAFFRTIAVRSVLVTLASTGEPSLQPPTSMEPWSVIQQPQPMEEVSGSECLIVGSVMPISNRPIAFELISDNGRVLGSSQLPIETPGEKLDFKISLYYSYIRDKTDVRLIIRQNHYPYDEIAILDSIQLIVNP